jgi:hypothetical protein
MNLSLLTEKNPDAKRRRALANVYELLLKLAEGAKRQPEDSTPNNNHEDESVPVKENIPR